VPVLLAALGTAGALASGSSSMAHDGEVARKSSARWMVWLVGRQGAAFFVILPALLVSR